MALVECRECKKEISSEAKVCPSCGIEKPYQKPPVKVSPRANAVTAIVLIVAFVIIFKNCSSPKDQSVSVNANGQVILSIPSDPGATYFIIERGGNSNKPTITTRRVGSSGESYATRIFDCKAGTTKYLAYGETLEELKSSKPEKKMYAITDESIAWYQYEYLCGKGQQTRTTNTLPTPNLTAHQQVAKDAIEKATIAMDAKDLDSACAYVGIATAAYLEGKDEALYKSALKLKKKVCSHYQDDE